MKFRLLTFVSLILLTGCGNSTPDIVEQSSPSVSISSSQALPAIKISDIAGNTPDVVAKVLGSPTSTETVNPSRTPCPCEKRIYKNGEIEIVFMEGKADWITVNLPPSQVDTSGSYSSVQQFDNPTYTYIKVKTN